MKCQNCKNNIPKGEECYISSENPKKRIVCQDCFFRKLQWKKTGFPRLKWVYHSHR